jgi:hypothetical protein
MNLVGLFSDTGTRVTRSLEQLLQDAGCRDIHQTWHRLDYSFGTPAHGAISEIMIAAMRLAQPFLLSTKIASQEHLDALFNQVEMDMFNEGFQSFWDFLTVWGTVS